MSEEKAIRFDGGNNVAQYLKLHRERLQEEKAKRYRLRNSRPLALELPRGKERKKNETTVTRYGRTTIKFRRIHSAMRTSIKRSTKSPLDRLAKRKDLFGDYDILITFGTTEVVLPFGNQAMNPRTNPRPNILTTRVGTPGEAGNA